MWQTKCPFTRILGFATLLPVMFKKLVPVSLLALLLTGCATTLTNLTPQRQERNANNLYPVEVALTTRQQSLKWDTITPQIVVGTVTYPMRQTVLMTNRWEGLVPLPKDQNQVHYRYKFDFDYLAMGQRKTSSVLSPEYTLRVQDK